jgi:hypothetical protein
MKVNNSNIKLKIACLIFAFLSWVYVMSELDPVDTRDLSLLDVKITNIDELNQNNLVLSPNQNLKVGVKIKGKRSVIAKKIKEGVYLQTTLKDAKIGENTAQVVPTSDSIDINYDITPKTLKLNIEENVTGTYKIKINPIGNLEKGTSIDLIKLSKDNIKISGAKSLIEKLQKVQVDVDFSQKSEDFSAWYPLNFLDSDGNDIVGLFVDVPQVMVSVTTKKEKTVPIVADISESDDKKTSQILLEPQEITIYAKEEKINNVVNIVTEKIDTSKLQENKDIIVKLVFPDGVTSDISNVKARLKK